MYKNIKKNLREFDRGLVTPDKDWVKQNRELLLSQIKNTTTETKAEKFAVKDIWQVLSVLMPRSLVYGVARPLSVILVVAVVATSGWIATVDASHNALPGDWLYPVKRAAEKTKTVAASLVGGEEAEAKARVENAKIRAEEVKKIVQDASGEKKEKVKDTINDLKEEIGSVNENLENIKADPGAKETHKIVKALKQQTINIKNTIDEVQTDLLTSSNNEDRVLSEELSQAKDVVKGVEEKGVEVVVVKHLSGDETITSEAVKEIIDETLKDAAFEVENNKKNVETAGKVLEEMKNNQQQQDLVLNMTVSANALNTSSTEEGGISTSTKQTDLENLQINNELGVKIGEIEIKTKEATQKASEAGTQVEEKINEVKKLIEVGALDTLVDKIREVNLVVKESENISKETLNNIKEVLPVVKVVKEPAETEVESEEIVNTSTTNVSASVGAIVEGEGDSTKKEEE